HGGAPCLPARRREDGAESASRWVGVPRNGARPPLGLDLVGDAAARSALVSAMATCAPSSAKSRAVASPMPEAPPVTAAILPSSRPLMIASLGAALSHTQPPLRGAD